MRSIRNIYKAQKVNMGGIILDQALPLKGINQLDPFILIHHWSNTMKGGQQQSEVGVGPHPHRGFSPVTFIYKGGVHHRDSTGTENIIYDGGTQWMNSGKGIIHSERPTKELAEHGGDFELIQFWINAPKVHKFDEPNYQPLTLDETPLLNIGEGDAQVYLVAGKYEKQTGPIVAHSDVLILRLEMPKGSNVKLKVPKSYSALLYQLDGNSKINDLEEINNKDMVVFNNDEEEISIVSKEDSRLILLSGEPIKEPVATYGPFVMNTQNELMEAINDYQSGKMGELIENFN